MARWDKRFLDLAQHIASWSKDPSTKVGAVIVRPDRTVASVGFNGFPRGIEDDAARYECRDTKYAMVVHAELNAIIAAKEPLTGYTLYSTFFPCPNPCAGAIIQAGIKHVVVPRHYVPDRWREKMQRSEMMFDEAGVTYDRWMEDPLATTRPN